MVASGALNEYEWFLKVDADMFLRPSALRKAFRSLHSSPGIGNHITGTSLDGNFNAVRADLARRIQSLDWPVECDLILSGNNNNDSFAEHKAIRKCTKRANISKFSLRDTHGQVLVAQDEDGDADGCFDVFKAFQQRGGQNINGTFLCQCKLSA